MAPACRRDSAFDHKSSPTQCTPRKSLPSAKSKASETTRTRPISRNVGRGKRARGYCHGRAPCNQLGAKVTAAGRQTRRGEARRCRPGAATWCVLRMHRADKRGRLGAMGDPCSTGNSPEINQFKKIPTSTRNLPLLLHSHSRAWSAPFAPLLELPCFSKYEEEDNATTQTPFPESHRTRPAHQTGSPGVLFTQKTCFLKRGNKPRTPFCQRRPVRCGYLVGFVRRTSTQYVLRTLPDARGLRRRTRTERN